MVDTLQLIVAAIVPGYVFIHYDYKSQYKAPLTSDRLLYTQILFCGILFSTIAILITPILLYSYSANFPKLQLWLHEIYPADLTLLKHIFVIVVATCLAWFMAKLRSFWTLRFEANFHVDFLMEHGTELQKFATKVIVADIVDTEKDLLIEIRLKNNKVYIGVPAEIPGPIKPNYVEYFHLLPFHSGYRDADTHALRLTTHYIEYYEEVLSDEGEVQIEKQDSLLNSFKVAICADEIVTIRQFDPDLYFEKYQAANNAE